MKCNKCNGTGTTTEMDIGMSMSYGVVCLKCNGRGFILSPAERLIVAADFKPPSNLDPHVLLGYNNWVEKKVLTLAQKLNGTGVYLKVNSALRAVGYGLIREIQVRGLRVFADLKLFDISETLSTDGALIKEFKPDILTTVCLAGAKSMQALKDQLPDTEILGVTVLTSLSNEDSDEFFRCSTEEAVLRLAKVALRAKIDGLVCSPKEAQALRAEFGTQLTLNTPAIRPSWAIVPGDDQDPQKITTPAKAIKSGADRIVVGRPIVGASNPYDAVMRTIEEIAVATAELEQQTP